MSKRGEKLTEAIKCVLSLQSKSPLKARAEVLFQELFPLHYSEAAKGQNQKNLPTDMPHSEK